MGKKQANKKKFAKATRQQNQGLQQVGWAWTQTTVLTTSCARLGDHRAESPVTPRWFNTSLFKKLVSVILTRTVLKAAGCSATFPGPWAGDQNVDWSRHTGRLKKEKNPTGLTSTFTHIHQVTNNKKIQVASVLALVFPP